jgi:hypothetical protein
LKLTSPYNASSLGPASVPGLCVLNADVEDDEREEAEEVQESNDCGVDVGYIDDD